MGGADQREAATLCFGNLGRCGRLASGCGVGGKRRLNPNAATRRERFSRSAGRAWVPKPLLLTQPEAGRQRLAERSAGQPASGGTERSPAARCEVRRAGAAGLR
jgi:hypothetical protein